MNPARSVALGSIRLYQKILSPAMGRNCRYSPTCSAYAYQAIERFGLLKGVRLGAARLSRCHPLREGGYDPVPDEGRTT